MFNISSIVKLNQMKNYKFAIGNKTLEFLSPSVESAYSYAESYALFYGWKGKIKLLS